MSKDLSPLEVRGVLLPLRAGQLLIPNASLCEVVGYQHPEDIDGKSPDWLLGTVHWRQRNVPLVSFESLTGASVKPVGQRARIAMCYTLNGNSDRPFIGILLRSIPHLVRVMESVIKPLGDPEEFGPMVAGHLQIGGQEAWIPDMDVLESALEDILD
ncbi:MAG: chemotaxis protein CheW [Gammaproteobacteria bacterium]|nr:chemotaxis protein CheW [Gammaproteobacteria bacterium]